MQTFRRVEISDPAFERDQLRFLTVKSANLKGRGDICVFIPPGSQLEDLPVVILLHGVYGSAWSWALNGGAHKRAMDMITKNMIRPMILAMPSDGLWGDGSGYLPHGGFDFESWITKDVPDVLQQFVPGVSMFSKFFICGLSMGGFGALRLAVKFPHLFRAVSAHSSITQLDQMKIFVEEDLSEYKQPDMADESVFETVLLNRGHLPHIRFDCGVDDELIGENRLLHRQLSDHDIPHLYEEFPGVHEWSYWQEHVGDSLLFFNGML